MEVKVANKTTQKPDDPTEVIAPAAETRVIELGIEPHVFRFEQKPLSFFGKMEVFSVLGSAMEKAMAGPNGISLDDLMVDDGEDAFKADTFVRAISKLVIYAPELFADLFVIVLAVPRGSREAVKSLLDLPPDEGGISDDDGWGIIETFIDQNWDVMADFFSARIKPLIDKVSSKVQESQPSKP
jgi:hypothetical protein